MYTRIAHRARARKRPAVAAPLRVGSGGGGSTGSSAAVAHRPFCYAMRPCECEGRSATTQGRPIDETASDRDRVSESAVGAWLETSLPSQSAPTILVY